MPYRRGLMVPTQWAIATNSARRGGPFVAIACPDCDTKAVLQPDDGFTCVYGHRRRRSELEFECPQDDCRRTAKISMDGRPRCPRRHEFECKWPSGSHDR